MEKTALRRVVFVALIAACVGLAYGLKRYHSVAKAEKSPNYIGEITLLEKAPDEVDPLFSGNQTIVYRDWRLESPPQWFTPQAPWRERTQQSDRSQKHEQTISTLSGNAPMQTAYAINMRGNVDGVMYRDPVGVWYWTQEWEPNIAVRMENIGQGNVVNPWLYRAGQDFSSVKAINESFLKPGLSEKEKALILYWLHKNHGIHAGIFDPSVKGKARNSVDDNDDPVRFFNIYGYGLCRDVHRSFSALLLDAGLAVRRGNVNEHNLNEIKIDGKWGLFDVDYNTYFKTPGADSFLSVSEIERDQAYVSRSRAYGINNKFPDPERPTANPGAARYATFFHHPGDEGKTRHIWTKHSMDMTLRPGESLTWRWGHRDHALYRSWKPLHEETRYEQNRHIVANGLWEYAPDLQNPVWQDGVEHKTQNIGFGKDGLFLTEGDSGTVTWKIHAPYLMLGGMLNMDATAVSAEISFDKEKWAPLQSNDLSAFFPVQGRPRHTYFIRITFKPESQLKNIGFINDLQMAPLALPALTLGRNDFVYRDNGSDDRKIRITHIWAERESVSPPQKPAYAIHPEDPAENISEMNVLFEWQAPLSKAPITDYHIQISDDPAMRWPVSTFYNRQMSMEKDKITPNMLFDVSDLTYGQTYYWHVRAKSADGIWGPWSAPWRFSIMGPARPENGVFKFDRKQNTSFLVWENGAAGVPPAGYKIYGSDWQGFEPHDGEHAVMRRINNKTAYGTEPSNLILKVNRSEFSIGQPIKLPERIYPFYKVVAFDSQGNQSAPSAIIPAPTPLLMVPELIEAKMGDVFIYRPQIVHSQGRWLQKTDPNPAQSLSFTAVKMPKWLSLEPDGTLKGMPSKAGLYAVEIMVSLPKVGSDQRRFTLKVNDF